MPARAWGKITGFVGPKGSGKSNGALCVTSRERRIVRMDMNEQPAMAHGAEVAQTRAELIAALRDRGKACYRGADFDFACRATVAFSKCVALIDEAESWMRGRHITPAAETIIRRGRHKKVDCVWTAFRPTNVVPDLRQNTDVMYLFPGHDVTYYRFVREFIGHDGLDMLLAQERYCPVIVEAGKPPRAGKKFPLKA